MAGKTYTRSELEDLERLDAGQLLPVTNAASNSNHIGPDIIEAGDLTWAALTSEGRLALSAAYSDPEESRGSDRLLPRRRVYEAIGLNFLSGSLPAPTTHMGLERYSSLIKMAGLIETRVKALDMSETAASAHGLAVAIKEKRREALIERVQYLNDFLDAESEIVVRLVGFDGGVPPNREQFLTGEPSTAKRSRIAQVKSFVLTEMPLSDDKEEVKDGIDLVMADRNGAIGRMPQGYKLYGPYMQAVKKSPTQYTPSP